MELFKFIRLGIIFIGVGLSNCSTPGEYKIQGTATGIGTRNGLYHFLS